MSNLKKGQNMNKSADVELDSEISLDAELIGKLITQQVAAAMAKKTNQYESKINKLRKVERIGCWESPKNWTRGGWCASKKKEEYTTTTTTTATTKKSKTQQQSASRSSQGQNSILWTTSREQNREAGDANNCMLGNK